VTTFELYITCVTTFDVSKCNKGVLKAYGLTYGAESWENLQTEFIRSVLRNASGAIQPNKDDGNFTLQYVREWQQNDPNIQVIVSKLSRDGSMFDHPRKLYVILDKVLYHHPLSIPIVNGEEGMVARLTKPKFCYKGFTTTKQRIIQGEKKCTKA